MPPLREKVGARLIRKRESRENQMAKLMRGTAKEAMKAGDHVLCRGFEVQLAPKATANGTVRPRPAWEERWHGQAFKAGEHVTVDPIEGLGERDLHAIAAGPIMEPLALYLPAGKLTEAEYQARLDLQFREAGIEPDA